MASLYARSEEEIMDLLSLHKSYQARQVMAWLVKGVTDWDRMSDLPLKDRTRFKEEHICTISSHIVDRQDDRSAVKLLVQLEDKALIECVMLSDGTGRKTACISSQVGCAMGCAFCKTGTMGLVRNLKDYEIVEQMVHLRTLDPTIGHIVFMGMGEPLHNLGALMSAITYFHNPKLFNISYRKMTVSTCGLVPGIRSLGELDLGIRLAVSLVSADDETRSRIMRVNRTYPLSELKKALIAFQHTCDKRITLEYCMLGGVNTTPEAAKDLASFTAGLFAVVNLIPWNPIEGMEWRTPDAQEIRSFTSQLDRLRVNYTLRMTKGRGISGACGQLATSSRREPSVSSSRRRP